MVATGEPACFQAHIPLNNGPEASFSAGSQGQADLSKERLCTQGPETKPPMALCQNQNSELALEVIRAISKGWLHCKTGNLAVASCIDCSFSFDSKDGSM